MACIQYPINYPYKDISVEDEIFIYVKNYCRYSKFACKFLTQHGNKITIVDMVNKEFVLYNAYNNFERTVGDATKLTDIFPNKSTVPQIFIYKDEKWYSIGGSDDLLKLHIVQSNNTQTPTPSLRL